MKKVKLGELADVIVSGVDKKTKDSETPVKLCNFVNVYYNWAVTSEMYDSFMDASARDAEIDKFSLSKGQVAITKDSETRFDIGIPTYIADDFEGVLLGYHCALITPNQEVLNGKYLNALLHSDYAKEYFANNATGSGQRYTISEDTIKAFPVPLIPIEEQVKIGNYLSDIDRKISCNKKQNDLLEKLAKQLYDYWFVQFDFPDENGKPYKSSGGAMVYNEQLKREIPKGWECKKLENILDVISRRTTIESAKSLNYAPIEVIPRNKMSFHECAPIEKAVSGLCEFEKKHILLSNRRVYFHKVCIAPFDGITRDTVIVFQPKIINSLAYSFQIVNSDSFIGYATQQSYGSEQPVLSWTAAKEYKVAFPSQHLIDKYCEKMNDFIELVLDNENEQNYLKKLRNVILPLLMTGQATLK